MMDIIVKWANDFNIRADLEGAIKGDMVKMDFVGKYIFELMEVIRNEGRQEDAIRCVEAGDRGEVDAGDGVQGGGGY